MKKFTLALVPFIGSEPCPRFTFEAEDLEEARSLALGWLNYQGMLRSRDDLRVYETKKGSPESAWAIHNDYVR